MDDQMPFAALRLRFLEDHRVLRMIIRDVNAFAERAMLSDAFSGAELRSSARDLVSSMLSHMGAEEGALLPVLRGIDCWGAERAFQMEGEHRLQRAMFGTFLELLRGDASNQAVAGAASVLTRALLVDMDDEERDFLSADLLRDDVVAIDQSDG